MKTSQRPLFEVKEVDRAFYEGRLRDFLPSRVIDIHTHVWLSRFISPAKSEALRSVTWPARVARDNSIEDLLETYRLLLPGKAVTPLIFGSTLKQQDDLDGNNAYVSASAAQHGCPALIFTRPSWTGAELEQRIRTGGFLGAKAYLSLSEAYLPEKEIRIFDFLPHHHWEVLDRNGWIVILHIPRDGRLRDPVNLAQLLEIEARYPRAKVVVAHVGRAYCPEDIVGAFEVLAKTERLCFDISANTNADVFRRLIQAVGPKRILFGSDLPILRMRMRRVCEAGNYVNIVPNGLYGDVSGDRHMREVDGAEAERLTFFLYEELDAFHAAVEAEGLGQDDVQAVFHDNAASLLEGAQAKPTLPQIQMIWPRERVSPPAEPRVPAGYRLRTFEAGDEPAYVRLMQRAGFTSWNDASAQQSLAHALPAGLFFVEHEASHALVATAAANHCPSDLHPFGAELGWVAADPEHQGHGLGAVVCVAAVRRLLSAGYTDIYLKTDDFRLAAIKTYVKLGWMPFLYAPGMQARWEAIGRQLGMDLRAKPVS